MAPPRATKTTPSYAFRRLTTQVHLRDVFASHIEKSSARGRDGIGVTAVSADLGNVIRDVSQHCRDGTLRFTTYRQRLVLKGLGQFPRELSIPTVRDRMVLRVLSELLIAVFPHSAGRLPQMCVAAVMKDLDNKAYDTFVRIDVMNFYPSIDHDVLLDKIGSRVKKKEILRLLRSAITTPTAADKAPRPRHRASRGVPQGLSIANPLAELYLDGVDQRAASNADSSYHRFVDDILILCHAQDAPTIDAECRAALAEVGLEAHPPSKNGKSQIGLISDGFTYLGYVFSSSRVSVRSSSVTRLEAHLASIHATWQHELNRKMNPTIAMQRFLWHRNLAITGCVFQGAASGWLQYFRQMTDLTLLKRLDATVDRLGKRYSVPKALRPKTFMRSYWVIKHPRSRSAAYVPNFDLYGLPEMGRELRLMGSDTSAMSEDEIKDSFYRMVSKAVRDLEHDVGDLS